jgi:TetR/AcrR family transcriptional regulator
MAERRTRNPERTRAAIIAAAVAELMEKGSVNLTIGEVARRAGVTPGALTAHFVNREGLLAAAYEECIKRVIQDPYNLRELARLQFGQPDATGEDVFNFAQHLAQPHSQQSRRQILEGLLQAHYSERLMGVMRPFTSDWIETIAEQVRLSQAGGRTRSDIDARAIALVWAGTVMGVTALFGVAQPDYGEHFRMQVMRASDIAAHAFHVDPADDSSLPPDLGAEIA